MSTTNLLSAMICQLFSILFFSFFNLLCNYLILLCKSYSFIEPRGYVAIGAPPCSSLQSRHTTVMIMYVFSGDESQ